MILVDCVGKLSDPVTQGDVFSIAQFFVKRVMIMTGDESLVTLGENCFGVGTQDFASRPATASFSRVFPAVVAAPGRYRHGQAVRRETEHGAYQAAAEKGAQTAIVFVLGIGKVAVSEEDFFTVKLNTAALRKDLASQPIGKNRTQMEVVVALHVNQFCTLLVHPLEHIDDGNVDVDHGCFADPEFENVTK